MTEPPAGRATSQQHASVGSLVAVVTAVVVIDQLTKAWAVSALSSRTIHVVWTLQFHLAYNTGMAFGTGRAIGPIIGAFATLVVVGLLVTMRRGGGRVADLAVGLVVGGAIGNLIDRLFRGERWLRGGVVDFIDFQWFWIFNVADMAITIGGAILLFNAYRHRTPQSGSSHDADTQLDAVDPDGELDADGPDAGVGGDVHDDLPVNATADDTIADAEPSGD